MTLPFSPGYNQSQTISVNFCPVYAMLKLSTMLGHRCPTLGPATTQNLVVKFDGEICGGVLVENASDIFPSKRSSKISFQTSPEVRHRFRRKLRQLHSGNRWCLQHINSIFPRNAIWGPQQPSREMPEESGMFRGFPLKNKTEKFQEKADPRNSGKFILGIPNGHFGIIFPGRMRTAKVPKWLLS